MIIEIFFKKFAFLFNMFYIFISKSPVITIFISRLFLSFLFLRASQEKMQTSQIPARVIPLYLPVVHHAI